MRVCPKCGYVDPPEWRHSRYSYWIDFTEFENFKRLNPELAENFKKGTKKQDENFVYRRNKSTGNVERKAKIDYGGQWTIPMERRNRKEKRGEVDFRKCWIIDPPQTKIEEF